MASVGGNQFHVDSGVGIVHEGDRPFVAVVRVIAHDNGGMWDMTPAEAQDLGIRLITAAAVATAEASIRQVAKETGADGDSIIGHMKSHLKDVV
jgi:hypothetical protein